MSWQFEWRCVVLVLQPHPFLVRLYEDAEVRELSFEPKTLPSLVPPIPWVSHNVGGNLLSTSNVVTISLPVTWLAAWLSD